jgi:dCMP deaminase
MRKPNKKTEYLCGCGKKFFLQKKISHTPKCTKCSRKEYNARCRKAKRHLIPKYRENMRNRVLKKEYGMDRLEYNRMLEQQNGVCAICKKKNDRGHQLCVDHNHISGKIRGLLCHKCNRILGVFKDDISNFRSSLSYLTKFENRRSWDEYFLDIAELVSTRSKDPSTKVGAILVRDKVIISTGYNGFPRGINDDISKRYDRPEKYLWTIHAEENAIFNAVRVGVKTENSILYVTPMSPCSNCALSIVQAGIKEVVFQKKVDNPRFDESCQKAFEIFEACKVLIRNPE